MTDTQKTNLPSIISLDDDLAMNAVYHSLAERLNADHMSFSTIENTLDHVCKLHQAPHILMLDRLLPDGDGLDFAVYVRKNCPQLAETYFLLISGAQTQIFDLRLTTARIEKVIEKPFRLSDLMECVGGLLSQRAMATSMVEDSFINVAFADDLLRLSMELLHASQSDNANPNRILHSIHGIAGMLENELLRSTAARLMKVSDVITEIEYLPMILRMVQQCEEVAQKLIENNDQPSRVAL